MAPSATVAAGATWSTITVRIEDAFGNLVTSASDTVTLSLATGTSTLTIDGVPVTSNAVQIINAGTAGYHARQNT